MTNLGTQPVNGVRRRAVAGVRQYDAQTSGLPAVLLARSRSPEQFVGQYARPAVREALAAASQGHVESVTLDGKNPDGWVPQEKISVEEALRAYTAGNAYGVFAEDRRGKLAPGYLADIVLIDRDLTRIPTEEIEQAAIKATVVGGRVVYTSMSP